MHFVGDVPLIVLCAAFLSVYAGISLDLALQLSVAIAISASIGVSIPDLLLDLGIVADINLGVNAAVAIGLPSITAQLGVSLSVELSIILGFVVALAAVLKACASASLDAYTYSGPTAGLSGAMTGALASGWPDGTAAAQNVSAVVLVASSSGLVPADAVSSVTMAQGIGTVPGGGQGWETGLCSVAFSPPPSGGSQVTGTVTLAALPNGAKTIVSVNVTSRGSGYSSPPSVTFIDSAPVTGCTNTSPIVLTVASTEDVTSIAVKGVEGCTAANSATQPSGYWCAKVLSPTTLALYHDTAFTQPVSGNGPWTSGTGTVTGNGTGAAAFAVMGGGSKAQLRAFFDGLTFPGYGLGPGVSLAFSAICGAVFGLMVDLFGNLQLRAKMLASANAKIGFIPPTVAGNLSVVASADARLNAAIKLVPPIPSIQAKFSAALSARVAMLVSLVARIGAQLGIVTENLGVYTYTGTGIAFGPALAGIATAPDADVVVLAATSSASAIALSTFFGGI